MAYSCKLEVTLRCLCTLAHLIFHCITYNHLFLHFALDIYNSVCLILHLHYIVLFLFTLSHEFSFTEFVTYHLQVSVCFDPVHPGHFNSQSLFPPLSLPQLKKIIGYYSLLVILILSPCLGSMYTHDNLGMLACALLNSAWQGRLGLGSSTASSLFVPYFSVYHEA
jgi:hypothetical protein